MPVGRVHSWQPSGRVLGKAGVGLLEPILMVVGMPEQELGPFPTSQGRGLRQLDCGTRSRMCATLLLQSDMHFSLRF